MSSESNPFKPSTTPKERVNIEDHANDNFRSFDEVLGELSKGNGLVDSEMVDALYTGKNYRPQKDKKGSKLKEAAYTLLMELDGLEKIGAQNDGHYPDVVEQLENLNALYEKEIQGK